MKTRRIEELEKEVESLRKKKNDEWENQKMAEANHLKLKDELARVHQAMIDEAASFKTKAKEIMARYSYCLRGIGCDTKFSAEWSTDSFMDWLRGKVSALRVT